jgi:hypothetical protein
MTGTRISVFLNKMFRITTNKFLTEKKNMALLLEVLLHYTAPLLTVIFQNIKMTSFTKVTTRNHKAHLRSSQLLVNRVLCVVM